MHMTPLVAAQRLDCNQMTYDQREMDRAILRGERRLAIWRSRMATLKALARSLRHVPAFPTTVSPAR